MGHKIKMCRICFVTDSKMYLMTSITDLNEAFETLTGVMMADEEHLPRYLCIECADQLMNCAHFRRRSLRAHIVLLDIIRRHGRITVELVQSINKIHNSLNSAPENKTSDDNFELEIKDVGMKGLNELIDTPSDSIYKCVDRHENINELKSEINHSFNHCDDDSEDDKKDVSSTKDQKETNDLYNQEDVKVCSSKIEVKIIPKIVVTDEVSLTFCSFDLKKEMAVDGVNIENYGITSLDVVNDEVISHNSEVHSAGLNVNSVSKIVKIEYREVVHEDCSAVDKSSSEDVLGDPLLTAVEQKIETVTETLQKEMDINDQKPPEFVGGLSTDGTLWCDISHYRTDSDVRLLEHLKTHAAGKKYCCDMCNYSTDSRTNLNRHETYRKNVFNHKSSDQKYTRAHAEKKPYSCHVCKKVFESKRWLQLHSIIHSGEIPYLCHVCGKAFREKCVLETHIHTHSNEKRYSCDICKKAFRRKEHLQRHLNGHYHKKTLKCNVSKTSFNDKKHIKLHSGEIPFSCNICNKAFRLKEQLKAHLKTHTDEKPYLCEFCTKRFKDIKQLGRHTSIHTGEKPHSCKICSKSFRLNYMLIKHLKTHSSETPYSCEYCKKAFKRKEHLQNHLLIHSDEKPYSCDICRKSFKRKINLRTHLIGVHRSRKTTNCH